MIEADNGSAYVVKFTDNLGGGRRSLVNEFIGSTLLTHLGIATPACAFIQINEECVGKNDCVPTGVHFGSLYPGTHDRIAVWDRFPNALLSKVLNYHHFVGALMVDQWTANADSRQSIFFRERINEAGATQDHWVTQMIDNGSLFGGRDWTLPDSQVVWANVSGASYGLDLSTRDFEPWLNALEELRPQLLNEAVAELPGDWFQPGDGSVLKALLKQLWKRRERVPVMLKLAVELLQTIRPRSLRRTEVLNQNNMQIAMLPDGRFDLLHLA